MMRKKRGNSGFTMAELLIVVAIIGVLSGVAFLAVQQHQRSLAQLDRNTAAKELYFAAQNHLKMAYAQGYLGANDFGENDEGYETDKADKVYYLVNGGSSPENDSMLDIMLPFGSIDETVRSNGSYLIRYQPDTATVLDVFYCSTSAGRFDHVIAVDEYRNLMENKNAAKYSGYLVGWYGGGEAGQLATELSEPVVSIDNGERLVVTVQDTNAGVGNSILELIVSGEVQADGKQAKMVILLRPDDADKKPNELRVAGDTTKNIFKIVLDDIASEKYDELTGDYVHFSDLNVYADGFDPSIWFMEDSKPGSMDVPSGNKTLFRPGENITVEAVVFSNSVLSNIAYSSAKVTNSLFADFIQDDAASGDSGSEANSEVDEHTQVRIAGFRHLENLDPAVSRYQPVALTDLKGDDKKITATQAKNLDWEDFIKEVRIEAEEGGKKIARIHKQADVTGTNDNCYLPVNANYAPDYDGYYALLDYDGNGHSIKNVKVEIEGDAGLFGSMTGGAISNLKLIDFDIRAVDTKDGDGNVTDTYNAGALAGSLTNVRVSNVLAHNDSSRTASLDIEAGKNAGGLIGSATGGSVEKSAAALIVKGGDTAGGLVGTTAGDTKACAVTACYSGGHAEEKALGDGKAVVYNNENYNVTAAGVAGGLIGSAANTDITYSYSTCSATGETAGGLVGTYTGTYTGTSANSIADCYAAGLVKGTGTEKVTVGSEEVTFAKEGAFAYRIIGSSDTSVPKVENCRYYDIVNERPIKEGDKVTDYTYLPALGRGATNGGIAALDGSAKAYNDFVGEAYEWRDAKPYSTILEKYYDSSYPFKTVEQLSGKSQKDEEDKTDGTDETDETGGSDGTDGTSKTDVKSDFVATHYGDWPMPEIFVINEK